MRIPSTNRCKQPYVTRFPTKFSLSDMGYNISEIAKSRESGEILVRDEIQIRLLGKTPISGSKSAEEAEEGEERRIRNYE